MSGKFRIGIFTSAWDSVAWALVSTLVSAVKSGEIPAEITFLLCSQEEGETPFGDMMIQGAKEKQLETIEFSSMNLLPVLRANGHRAAKRENPSVLKSWRRAHDQKVVELISKAEGGSPADLYVNLGYMWIMTETLYERCPIVNLHPALPAGPTGTYKEVIWELIRTRSPRSGVMIHLVGGELDGGPVVAYCHFPLYGNGFEAAWREVFRSVQSSSLEEIKEKEEERNLLYRLIRAEGVRRELKLVPLTIGKIVKGDLRVGGGRVTDSRGSGLDGGLDLTEEIDTVLSAKP